MTAAGDKRIIGRIERVDFPRFGLLGLEAKVDTGARTSSIHCADVRVEEENEDGSRHITFTLLDPEHPDYNGRRFRARRVGTKIVRSSNGEEQERHVVETDLVIAGRTIRTAFTLADREAMNYPVLLGRRLLRGNFLVDVARGRKKLALDEEE
ncbi:MAG: ribosomal protein modification protein RimK [Thermoleophilia bacterium]|nr:ribosomal protein modification protein RimK [Thermoleophilia bacterium]